LKRPQGHRKRTSLASLETSHIDPIVSTIKLRQAGFTKTIDTEGSIRNALQSLIDHKLLPPAAK
jgi:hypothetical protein